MAGDAKREASSTPLTLADMVRLLSLMGARIIEKLSAQLSADQATIDRHDLTIQQMEISLSDLETRLSTLESSCAALTKENKALKIKVDDLENRLKGNNIRIIGIPEGTKGQQPTSFMETFLVEMFGTDAFLTTQIADRAHQVAILRKRQDKPPRPLIA